MMKKTILFLALSFLVSAATAQWATSPANGNNIYSTNSGNVGIGTNNPQAKLDVRGFLHVNRSPAMLDNCTTLGIPGGSWMSFAPSDMTAANNSYVVFRFLTNNSFRIGTNYDGNLSGGYYRDLEFGRYLGDPYLIIKDGGNVGIGTPTPKAKLAVNGNILAKQITVSLNNLPDYVFDKTYRLRPLSEVERYIQEYHHLPEVPSAVEVREKGLNLGDNQATLLKKIEELTLYVIEQDKQIKALQAIIKEKK